MVLTFSNLVTQNLDLIARVTYTCIATLIINLPFGYLRGRFKKFTFWWFAFIHLPVPFIILIRKFHGLKLTWELTPFLIGAFFLGQFLGKKIYKRKLARKSKNEYTSIDY